MPRATVKLSDSLIFSRLKFCRILMCLFVISGECSLYAEAPKTLEEIILEKTAIIHQNPHAGISVKDIVDHYDPNDIFAQAMQLIQDPNATVKEYGYQLLQVAGRTYQNPTIRQTAVSVFIEEFTDPGQPGSCSEMLLEHFQKKDYNADAKKKLRQRLDEVLSNQSEGYYARDIILLVGAADMQTEMDRLQWLIDQIHEPLQPFGAQTPRWHEEAFTALKAKARMGDQEAIQKCISLVDAVTDEDFKVITLLKHIAYIRQPQAVDYIKQYLYSDKKARDLGPNFPGAPYFYMAAHCLEKMIVGFPTHLEVSKFYQEKISTDPVFRKQWPLYVDYFGEHWRNWFEAQTSIEIIR